MVLCTYTMKIQKSPNVADDVMSVFFSIERLSLIPLQCSFIRLKNTVDTCYKENWSFTEGELDI